MNAQESIELKGITERHNYWRTQLKISPLEWSNEIALQAKTYASQLAKNGCQLKHDPNNELGENLYAMYGGNATPIDAIDSWANERLNYDLKSNTCLPGKVCGHYTQVIWENSKLVGCAVANGIDCQVWVCRYDPPGNWVGQWPTKP